MPATFKVIFTTSLTIFPKHDQEPTSIKGENIYIYPIPGTKNTYTLRSPFYH